MGREKSGERLLGKQNQSEEMKAKTQPWFTPKKGSVIPAKRRLVKRMMLDSIVKFMASLPCSCGGSPSEASNTEPKKYCRSSSKIVAKPSSSYGRKNNGQKNASMLHHHCR